VSPASQCVRLSTQHSDRQPNKRTPSCCHVLYHVYRFCTHVQEFLTVISTQCTHTFLSLVCTQGKRKVSKKKKDFRYFYLEIATINCLLPAVGALSSAYGIIVHFRKKWNFFFGRSFGIMVVLLSTKCKQNFFQIIFFN